MTNINPNSFTTRPEIEGTFGVVTSTHWIATAVGMAMLERGGNAFDAAVATAFTLQVVEPHLNGPGGDVPVIVYDTRKRKCEVICGQGPAPQGATTIVRPFQASLIVEFRQQFAAHLDKGIQGAHGTRQSQVLAARHRLEDGLPGFVEVGCDPQRERKSFPHLRKSLQETVIVAI